MVGLLILKQLENLSDEVVVVQFKRNPYYRKRTPHHLIKPNRTRYSLHFLKRIQHGLIGPLENPYQRLAKQWSVASGVLSTAPGYLQHIFSKGGFNVLIYKIYYSQSTAISHCKTK
jgi:hypothetical protein